MAYTKCPARYKNVGLESFGDKKKVTEELLKQFCKNDEYLYKQIRKLLDLTDPESRKRFHPPTFEDEIKSFGYATGMHNGKPCYMFNNGGEYHFGINFNTNDDMVFTKEGIVYVNDESIIDWNSKDGSVIVLPGDKDENGTLQIESCGQEDINEPINEPDVWHWEKPKPTTVIKKITKPNGKPKKDSYCYGPYGSMLPNGWWYVGYDLNKNYHIKPAWKKNPYKEGIPSKCRAQTFTAQHTGYVTKVNVNVISESSKKSASPFCVEIWKTKKGVPYGGAIARETMRFVDTNAYSGAHIKTFKFKKHASVVKNHKYAVVFRSPLSHRDSCYRIAGWPRECYTDYMKGNYYYGYAFSSTDNGKTWIRYDKNAYGKLHTDYHSMPIAFGFELYVQPTKTIKKKINKKSNKKPVKVIDKKGGPKDNIVGQRDLYPVGHHSIVFKIPTTNPIYHLHIDEGSVEQGANGTEITWDICYNNNKVYHTNDLIDKTMTRGNGEYDLSEEKPTFVLVRCTLSTLSKYHTPKLHSVKFIVHTSPTKKAFVRSLPYAPESETMLPACIWSEVNADYEKDDGVDVEVDVVKEIDATQTIRVRYDTLKDLWSYYRDFYIDKNISDFTDDDAFRREIQGDEAFLKHLKDDLEPPVYVLSEYPKTNPKYYKYFDYFELRNYPAYPIVSCRKVLGETILEVEDFEDSNYDDVNSQYSFKTNRELNKNLLHIVFREPQISYPNENDVEDAVDMYVDQVQEGVIENVLVEGVDYTIGDDNKTIIFKLDGENIQKNIVLDDMGMIKCFKLSDGTLEGEMAWDLALCDSDFIDSEDFQEGGETVTTGDIVELVLNLQDTPYIEHVHYTVDYKEKNMTPRESMLEDLGSCDIQITYNPLWVRGLETENFPLKMDMWTETFNSEDYRDDNDNIVYYTRVAPRDNLREVVLYDDEESLVRQELIEDLDFEVDYLTNKVTITHPVEKDTPITIRYTPNLTENALSLCYRMDRTDTSKQGYIYSNYFTTRT